ncbi:hypothetical protein [Caldimonas sp. KR1-144]|uniref:hypothetical protein n=1 Tax=Caldimonas sp. KR1-144 TaxID=3400911 RepID=UPI003C0B8780
MSPDSLSASPSAAARTPSDLKWLLNERAALEGQAQLASERQSTLERQVARLSLELQEASAELTLTLVAWTIEWLRFFELWLVDGEWRGGGRHPEPQASPPP